MAREGLRTGVSSGHGLGRVVIGVLPSGAVTWTERALRQCGNLSGRTEISSKYGLGSSLPLLLSPGASDGDLDANTGFLGAHQAPPGDGRWAWSWPSPAVHMLLPGMNLAV